MSVAFLNVYCVLCAAFAWGGAVSSTYGMILWRLVPSPFLEIVNT